MVREKLKRKADVEKEQREDKRETELLGRKWTPS